jgi:hypothetical protein
MSADGHASSPWACCNNRGGHEPKSNFVRQIFKPLLVRAGLPESGFTTCPTRRPRCC